MRGKAVLPSLPFIKMHGLGNDFVIIDGRGDALRGLSFSESFLRRLADRRFGIGCDQIIVLETAQHNLADVTMVIFNADGSRASTCGNAARCLGDLLYRQDGCKHHVIETDAGLLDAECLPDGRVCVDMGRAQCDWRDIPLKDACDTNHVVVTVAGLDLPTGVAVHVGNPHLIFFVDDCESLPLAAIGQAIGSMALFPLGVNVGLAHRLGDNAIRLRSWERGSGATLACGSNACAAVVAGARRRLIDRKADVVMNGGTAHIEWLGDDHVMMTGAVATSFSGLIDAQTLQQWQQIPADKEHA